MIIITAITMSTSSTNTHLNSQHSSYKHFVLPRCLFSAWFKFFNAWLVFSFAFPVSSSILPIHLFSPHLTSRPIYVPLYSGLN